MFYCGSFYVQYIIFVLTYFKISLRLVDLNVLEKSQFLTYGISSSHRWGLIPRPVVLDQCCNHVAGMGRLVIAPFGIFQKVPVKPLLSM